MFAFVTLLFLFSYFDCSMFLFTSLISPLENIVSHSKLGTSTTITIVIGVVLVGRGITVTITFVLFSLEEYEEFGGGSYTNDVLSHLLKLNT